MEQLKKNQKKQKKKTRNKKKKPMKNKRDKMHLKISELALHFTKIHKLMILEQFTVKC